MFMVGLMKIIEDSEKNCLLHIHFLITFHHVITVHTYLIKDLNTLCNETVSGQY